MYKKRLYLLVIASVFILNACKKDDNKISKVELPNWEVGEVLFDKNGWNEVVVGDMPLVISVPHGGAIKPDDIDDRTCDGATTVTDTYTIELARAIQNEMLEKYGQKPFFIISHLARTKVDQNRELEEATCGNSAMNATWEYFHNSIDSALNMAVEKFGAAIYIDLHAHGHAIQRLELGYSLTTSDLGKVYSGIEYLTLGKKSSFNNLLNVRDDFDIEKLITGDKAFGTLISEQGIPAVPSKEDPYVQRGQSYFNGGYNTRYYTSESYPHVNGWQIETNSEARNTEEKRKQFAKAFGKAINEFIDYVKP